MSRIGRKPVALPSGVTVTLDAGNFMTVKGPKGSLSEQLHPAMTIEVGTTEINVIRPNDEKENRSLHGLTRTLINNLVTGVTVGFKKELEINGVGYRAAKQGNQLVLNVGYSHPVNFVEPEGITIEVPAPNKIIINGINKQVVGQITAEIRKQRPPEPYLGKGIKYTTETIRRKAGKSGK